MNFTAVLACTREASPAKEKENKWIHEMSPSRVLIIVSSFLVLAGRACFSFEVGVFLYQRLFTLIGIIVSPCPLRSIAPTSNLDPNSAAAAAGSLQLGRYPLCGSYRRHPARLRDANETDARGPEAILVQKLGHLSGFPGALKQIEAGKLR